MITTKQGFSNAADNAAATANHLADSADNALRSTRRVANNTLDHIDAAVDSARDRVQPTISRLAEQAESAARRSYDAVRDGAVQIRERANGVSEATVRYVKDEPVKSVLIAAATGAALMGLLSLIQSARRNRY